MFAFCVVFEDEDEDWRTEIGVVTMGTWANLSYRNVPNDGDLDGWGMGATGRGTGVVLRRIGEPTDCRGDEDDERCRLIVGLPAPQRSSSSISIDNPLEWNLDN